MRLIRIFRPCFLCIWLLLPACGHPDTAPPSGGTDSVAIQSRVSEPVRRGPAGFTCALRDRKGAMWFGSSGKGLFRYEHGTFTHFGKAAGLCNLFISSMLEDRAGNLWFGTTDGLCHYDGERFEHIPLPRQDTAGIWLDQVYPIVNPNEVQALCQDHQGHLWIGTNGAGAYRYDGREFRPYLREAGRKQTDSLYHNIIQGIAEDGDGNLWFTSMTHGGASKWDGAHFTRFDTTNGLSDDMLRSVFRDSKGHMWFGFNGNRASGLNRFDGKEFTRFGREDGLCQTNIRCMFEDAEGKLWLGSGSSGICIFDGKSFTPFTPPEGGDYRQIMFITADTSGNIWFGGEGMKIYRFDGSEVEDMSGQLPAK